MLQQVFVIIFVQQELYHLPDQEIVGHGKRILHIALFYCFGHKHGMRFNFIKTIPFFCICIPSLALLITIYFFQRALFPIVSLLYR